jgi:hypothetical protein
MKRVGHQEIHGENIAQFEFSQAGWNPFKHYVDVDQVDLLLRRRTLPNPPEYREVQVKWCRTWTGKDLSKWQQRFFTHVSWRSFTTKDFAGNRPELFIAFVIPNAEQIYTGDIFVFTSREFHELILRAPEFKKGTHHKCFELAHHHDGRWFLLLKRKKFEQLDADSVFEVTASRRQFSVLN